MGGYEVARAFRSDEALKGVHLGCTMPEDVEQAAGAGFERHLSKPSSAEKIEEVLGTVPRLP
jgi:CheY-like chemotaxis protein